VDPVTRRIARVLLAVLLAAGIHVVAPAQATAEFRAATDCASHCAKKRGDDGCVPRCCLVGPETSSLATVAAAKHVERPAAALAVPLATPVAAGRLAAERVARLDVPHGAGPPVWLTVLNLRR